MTYQQNSLVRIGKIFSVFGNNQDILTFHPMFYLKQRRLADSIHRFVPKSQKGNRWPNFRSFPKKTKKNPFNSQAAFGIILKICTIFQNASGLQYKGRCNVEPDPVLMFDWWQLSHSPSAFHSVPMARTADKKAQVAPSDTSGKFKPHKRCVLCGNPPSRPASGYLPVTVKAKRVSSPWSLKPVLDLSGSLPCSSQKASLHES